ncbi:MAG: alpha/beta hydrolase fold domain-containing protein [Pseudomonadota bacterium]
MGVPLAATGRVGFSPPSRVRRADVREADGGDGRAMTLSPEARAFLADPANRVVHGLTPEAVRADRTAIRAAAEAEAPALAARFGLSLAWRDIGGVRTLEIAPEGASDAPPLLYIFGGGFITGGPLEDLRISGGVAARLRRRILSPTYGLAPEHPFPAALDDVAAVARAMDRPAAIIGESAGGNLALALTRRLIVEKRAPKALALLSPAVDLTDEAVRADAEDGPDDPTLSPEIMRAVPGFYAPDVDRSHPDISPINGAFGADWPPTIVTTGTRDRLVAHAARLARAIRESGGEVDLRLWPGLWRVFEYYDVPEAETSLDDIAAFLRARLA